MYEKHVPQPIQEYPKWVRRGKLERLVVDKYEEDKVIAEWDASEAKPSEPEVEKTVAINNLPEEFKDLPVFPLRKNGK